ncbi:hypothetical protein AB7M41_001499 [Bradyrhizobium diazoefficiens]
MAVQQHRTIEDAVAPQACYDTAKRKLGSDQPAGFRTGGRAQQAEPEDRATVRVDPRSRREHGALRLEANDPQPPHAAAKRTCIGQALQIGPDGRGAATKRARIHVIVTAIVDMAHQPRFRPGFELLDEAIGGDSTDGRDIGHYPRAAQKRPFHASCGHGDHDPVAPEMN